MNTNIMPDQAPVAHRPLPIRIRISSSPLPSLSVHRRHASDRGDSPTTAVEFLTDGPSLASKHLTSSTDAKSWDEQSAEVSSTTLNGDNMDRKLDRAPSSRLSIRRDSSETFSEQNDRSRGLKSEWEGSGLLCSVSEAIYFGKSSDTVVGGAYQVSPTPSQAVEGAIQQLRCSKSGLLVFPIIVPGDFFDDPHQQLYPIRPPLQHTMYPSRVRNAENELQFARPPGPRSDPFARFRPFTDEEWWDSRQSETDDSDYEQLPGEPEKPYTPQLIPKKSIKQKAKVQFKVQSSPSGSRKRDEYVDERMTPSRMFAFAGLETERIPLLAVSQPAAGSYGTILDGAVVEIIPLLRQCNHLCGLLLLIFKGKQSGDYAVSGITKLNFFFD
ncbi:hypothetical protein BJ742DRAFT_484887 [Cladochytrium replicatum]|nr:hypothetical protein BJ742DRAFT_484887 [Cladochytrium replicatum]